MKNSNTHTTRESWLRAATNELRPYFEKLGYKLPENMRFAIAFTSGGKRGRIAGECWHPIASDDQHYEIIIRADMAEPVQVLGVLVHELVHSLLPPEVKHGKQFREVALRVGLEGKMRHALPGPILRERLNALTASLGPLPHAKLNFVGASDVPKKQGTRLVKAECPASCGYTIRLAAKWARTGLPICPINSKHGKLICNALDDDSNDTIEPEDQWLGKK